MGEDFFSKSGTGVYTEKLLIAKLESYFEFKRLGTNWRTESLAGLTTFITMAYIVVVNPAILHDTGMPLAAVTAATCFSAAFGSILMGLFANYPIALAPGMGLNAYFTYTVVKGMGVPWQVALGAVFISGCVFLLLTLLGVRQMILAAIPVELYAAVSGGIGLFIAFIGFRNSGLVVADQATLVTIGNLKSPSAVVAIAGLIITAVLLSRGVKAAILFGILASAGIAAALGQIHWTPVTFSLSDITATMFQLNLKSGLKLGLLEIVFVFLFVDLFDNLGTLLAVGKAAGLIKSGSAERIPKLGRILTVDSISSIFSSLVGTSTVVSYIESAAGVGVGGRSGVTAVVAGLFFLLSLLALPLVAAIPASATAPALITVGSLMMMSVAEIDWKSPVVAIPAFLTLIMIPLSFSIANGLALGFISYTFIRVLRGEFRMVHWLVYVLTALFIARFLYLAGG
jgi:AGZA family xanthine/uracil permease-like MFS transporter